MSFDKSKVKKILLISLTNIGDVILSFPVMDILKQNFPSAKLSVVIGPKAESLLKGNPQLEQVIIFNKHQSAFKMIFWILQLRKEHFDLVIDLRNTAIPFLIGAKHKTLLSSPKIENQHMRDKHLARLKSVYKYKEEPANRYALCVSEGDKQYVEKLIKEKIGEGQKFICIAPGAASHTKRWTEQGFTEVADALGKNTKLTIVFIGDHQDQEIAQRISDSMQEDAVNLCGRTSLVQLVELMKKAQCVLTNDSAPMHLASYLNIPACALFGPTSPQQYGPWSTKSSFIKNDKPCEACTPLKKEEGGHTCMQGIESEKVLNMVQDLLKSVKAEGF